MSKTALIVDDSKSARMVLKRVLQTHAIDVVLAESANQALDYLTGNRPDVIFMDHMMPGMNGFEAVAAIKRNPQTATIPIMMYTSKKGEVYVGQARALGAVGVLPKGVAPVEVSKVLRALRLVSDDRREAAAQQQVPAARANGTRPVAAVPKPEEQAPARTPSVPPSLPANLDRDLRALLKDLFEQQQKILRRDLLDGCETIASRLADELRPPPHPAREQPVEPKSYLPQGFARAAILVLAGVALTLGGLYWKSHTSMHDLQVRNADLENALKSRVEAIAAARQQMPEAQGVGAYSRDTQNIEEIRQSLDVMYSTTLDDIETIANQTSVYPYGELPLGDERLATIEKLSDRLIAMNYTGVVRLDVHVADFCLKISASGGYELADPGLPVAKCDKLGLSPAEAYETGLGQSIAFANFIQLAEDQSGGMFRYEIVSVGNAEPLLHYPGTTNGVKAGAWNEVAAANNRVVVTLLPDSI